MPTELIDGRAIAKKVRDVVAVRAKALTDKGIKPGLAVVLVGEDPASVVYSASKAAVINLTRSLAIDHARQQIRVNCICPGAIDTPPVGRMLASDEARERAAKAHPLGRIGRPEDIAAAAVWLCSDEASWITGQALVVDGGLTAQSHLTGMADPRPAHLRPNA